MQMGSESDSLSMGEQLHYRQLTLKAPFRTGLKDLDVSASSSQKSMRISPNYPSESPCCPDDEFDELEDIRILRPSTFLQNSWSQQHQDFLEDLSNHLHDEPTTRALNFILRLRWIGKMHEKWRRTVLIASKWPRTKLALAEHLLRGPSILRRLPDLQLDVCVVNSRVRSACATEGKFEDILQEYQPSIWADLSASRNGVRLTIQDTKLAALRHAVGGGCLKVGNKHVILTALHPFIVSDDDKNDSSDLHFSVKGKGAKSIRIYHEDVADSSTESGSSETVLGQSVSAVDRVQTEKLPFSGDYQPLESAMKRCQKTLTSLRQWLNPRKPKSHLQPPGAQSERSRQLGLETFRTEGLTRARMLYQGADLDWAALELDADYSTYIRSFVSRSHIGGSILDDKTGNAVDVILGAAGGDIRGQLFADPVFYHVDGRSMKLQVVQLQTSLPAGSSGSWVGYHDRFCGMVIAASDDIPEAYILPAKVLIGDMERLCGAVVRLPTYEEWVLSLYIDETESKVASTAASIPAATTKTSKDPNNLAASMKPSLHSSEVISMKRKDRQDDVDKRETKGPLNVYGRPSQETRPSPIKRDGNSPNRSPLDVPQSTPADAALSTPDPWTLRNPSDFGNYWDRGAPMQRPGHVYGGITLSGAANVIVGNVMDQDTTPTQGRMYHFRDKSSSGSGGAMVIQGDTNTSTVESFFLRSQVSTPTDQDHKTREPRENLDNTSIS